MDQETKLLLGRMLGEVLSLRRALGLENRVGPAEVYGLLHGFERTVEDMLPETVITGEMEDRMANILDHYFMDADKLATFRGYYDMEPAIKAAGISRHEAIVILTKFRLEGRFVDVIDKIEGGRDGGSPSELLNLAPSEFDV